MVFYFHPDLQLQKPTMELMAIILANKIFVVRHQKHFLCTISGPASWYSALLIHMFWKVEREDSIEPPIQTKYFLSAGAVIFTFIPVPATVDTYLFNLSVKFGNIVVPPDRTMFEYKSFRISPSHFMTDWYVISWNPGNSFPIRLGLKRASGHLKL